jgi:hypothetical protein
MLTVTNPTKITMTTMITKISMFYGEMFTSSDIGTLHQPLYLCLLLWQLQRVRYIQNAFVYEPFDSTQHPTHLKGIVEGQEKCTDIFKIIVNKGQQLNHQNCSYTFPMQHFAGQQHF